MWPFIITVIVFIALSAYLSVVFISDIFMLLLNLVIMWVVLIRSYFEVRHKKIIKPYFIGIIIALLLFVFYKESIQIPYVLWQVWFITFVFITAELINLGIYLYKTYEVDKKFNTWLEKKKK